MKIIVTEQQYNKIVNESFVPRSVGIMGTRSTNSDMDTLDLNRTYEQTNNWAKPNGLWYQIGGKWNRLCDINNTDAEHYNHKKHDVFKIKKYNISLDIDFNDIAVLDTKDKVVDFSEKYGNGEFFINWTDVIKGYKGIEVYKNIRYYKWMNGWDIDSGCIWDLSSIKGYKVNDCEIIK